MSEDGVYQVTLLMTCEVRAVGYMITGNMASSHVDQPEEDLAQLDTARYYPDAVDAVLSGDEALILNEISGEIRSHDRGGIRIPGAGGTDSRQRSNGGSVMNVKKPRQPVRSGALTIVITCVLILLAVLSLLSLVSAQTDKALSDRQMAYAQQNAMSERAGQEWLASDG